MRVLDGVLTTNVPTEGMTSQHKLSYTSDLSPVLKELDEEGISLICVLGFPMRSAAASHSNNVKIDAVVLFHKRLHNFKEKDSRTSIPMDDNQLFLGSVSDLDRVYVIHLVIDNDIRDFELFNRYSTVLQ